VAPLFEGLSENAMNLDHAVVLGGGVAGLCAARVLTGHFAKVTVIDRDQLPASAIARKGTPQAKHTHLLSVGGARVLDGLFPGLQDELAAAGSPRIDWGRDIKMLTPSGWCPRFESDLISHPSSRPLLESLIRARIRQLPQITLLEEREVSGLIPGGDETVAGVRLRDHGELRADLVVEASGRDSKLPTYLEVLGYGPTEETTVNPFIGYATRIYRPRPGTERDWKVLLVFPRMPDIPRGGLIFPIENGEWSVTLQGIGRDYPPQDEEGFLEYARSLLDSSLHRTLVDAEAVSPITGYRRTENRVRHFERLRRWPRGLVALGDAVCSFNPIYGQGMTVAARTAVLLGEHLRAGLDTRRFQRQVARQNVDPWSMATTEDYRWPKTEGPPVGAAVKLLHAYMAKLSQTYPRNPAVARTFYEVVQMTAPSSRLVAPWVVGPVLLNALKGSPPPYVEPPSPPPPKSAAAA
jgi:2-polyprenyl-6-methoxyphenol hydroxylase-like FAD-dependent oxidoreductase